MDDHRDGKFEDFEMKVLKTYKDPLRRVIREAVKIKDVKECEEETVSVTVGDVETEIRYKVKLLNSKLIEFHLPTSVAHDVQGIA